MATSARLHTSLVSAENAAPDKAFFLLHGILGSGSNLRRLAQRFVARAPDHVAVLVDLRGHGRSELGAEPQTVASCAEDLIRLEQTLPLPVRGVIGHSFGGKVALSYYQRRRDLAQVVLLDSAPHARPTREGSEETLAIIDLLARAPVPFSARADFLTFIHEHGHSRTLADWLAMNLERTPQGFRLRLDIRQIRALLDDYFTLDLWPVVEQGAARIDLIIAGRSQVYGPDEVTRAQQVAEDSRGRVRVRRLPEAGHWVHVDAIDDVIDTITAP